MAQVSYGTFVWNDVRGHALSCRKTTPQERRPPLWFCIIILNIFNCLHCTSKNLLPDHMEWIQWGERRTLSIPKNTSHDLLRDSISLNFLKRYEVICFHYIELHFNLRVIWHTHVSSHFTIWSKNHCLSQCVLSMTFSTCSCLLSKLSESKETRISWMPRLVIEGTVITFSFSSWIRIVDYLYDGKFFFSSRLSRDFQE